MPDARPFPVTEQLVLVWSSVFSDTATYANYIAHLQKVCFFIGPPVTWLTPAVRHFAKGMKKCHGVSLKFPNFAQSRLFLRIIRMEKDRSEFAQAFWASFLFAFRAPSETLRLQMAFMNADISASSPQKEKSLIGIRDGPDRQFLVVKMKWRKNLTHGCVPRRPCFCTAGLRLANACCPVRVSRPSIRSRVPSGDPLFSAVNAREIPIEFRAQSSEN